MNLYKLIWDDFCSVYLEAVKPPFGEPISTETLAETQVIFGKLMALLHPYMPFISEEIHHAIHQGHPEKPLVVSDYPKPTGTDLIFPAEPLLLVSEIRNLRNAKGLSPKENRDIHPLKPDWVLRLATLPTRSSLLSRAIACPTVSK